MNTAKRFIQNAEYFDQLPDDVQALVRELVRDTLNGAPETRGCDGVEDLECRARDGFIPYSHNRGGVEATDFTNLNALWCSGVRVAHKKAQKEIERQSELCLEYARKDFFENNKTELFAVGVTGPDGVSYHDLYENGHTALAEAFAEYESEALSDDSSSIMFHVRFMYHGAEDGVHRASVSCAVNTEGPYHRSHISWAPGVFCEGAKEVEIEWRTIKQLAARLKKALKQTSEEVF
jgi:hypothetical protein